MNTKAHFVISRNIRFALFCCIFLLSSCSTVLVYQAGDVEGRVDGNQPGTEWTDGKRINTFFWGALRQDVIITDCRLGNGERLNIEEIKIEKNFGSILATIVTFGLWEPAKISWKCAKPKVATGELEEE